MTKAEDKKVDDNKFTEKETAALVKEKESIKEATIFHTDSGFAVNQVVGEDIVPTERYTEGLKGLFAKIEELEDAGFEVLLEGEKLA